MFMYAFRTLENSKCEVRAKKTRELFIIKTGHFISVLYKISLIIMETLDFLRIIESYSFLRSYSLFWVIYLLVV